MSLQETVSSWGGWGGHLSWCVRGERRESRGCNWDSQTSNWKWWQGWPLTWGYSARPSSAVCGRCPVGSVCLSWQDCPDLCRVWSWCTLKLSQLSSPSVSYILIFSCEWQLKLLRKLVTESITQSVTSHFNVRMRQYDSESSLLVHSHSQLEVWRPCFSSSHLAMWGLDLVTVRLFILSLLAMSSSSPPQPQNWLENPLTKLKCLTLMAATPPK